MCSTKRKKVGGQPEHIREKGKQNGSILSSGESSKGNGVSKKMRRRMGTGKAILKSRQHNWGQGKNCFDAEVGSGAGKVDENDSLMGQEGTIMIRRTTSLGKRSGGDYSVICQGYREVFWKTRKKSISGISQGAKGKEKDFFKSD